MAVESCLSENNTVLTLFIKGIFDIKSHKSFSTAYSNTVSKDVKIFIDLKEMEYLDSSGLGMLLVLREKAGGSEADIKIINASSQVKEIFKMANYHLLFTID